MTDTYVLDIQNSEGCTPCLDVCTSHGCRKVFEGLMIFSVRRREAEMARTISIGNQSFEEIREKGYFLVDKTNLIKEWWESADSVTLITRPRRFGKTINMDMLNCFFSNRFQGRGDLFEGLSIWKEEVYRRLQGSLSCHFLKL
mgnify:CR=1 FL=1